MISENTTAGHKVPRSNCPLPGLSPDPSTLDQNAADILTELHAQGAQGPIFALKRATFWFCHTLATNSKESAIRPLFKAKRPKIEPVFFVRLARKIIFLARKMIFLARRTKFLAVPNKKIGVFSQKIGNGRADTWPVYTKETLSVHAGHVPALLHLARLFRRFRTVLAL